jgi:hypothetical protein
LSGQLKEKLELSGKRKEVFKCGIDRSYFPKKDPPKTDPPPPDTPDQPEPPNPSVIHQKPVIIHEQSDFHRHQTMPPTPIPAAGFKKQCQTLFIAKQWPELLDLLEQRTKQMGSTIRAQNLQGAVVIFRSDYDSIRSQSRDGLVSMDEEQRLLVALWSRVLMLIDDIEGNLKL